MQQTVTCPNCGNSNNAGQQFCVSCGAHLGTSSPRSTSHMPVVTGIANYSPSQPTVITSVQPVTPVVSPAAAKQMEIKPTWGLAWGLFWRTFFLWLFFLGACFLIYLITRLALGYTSVF